MSVLEGSGCAVHVSRTQPLQYVTTLKSLVLTDGFLRRSVAFVR